MNDRAAWLVPVRGYEGIYSISINGRVWSHERTVTTDFNGIKRSTKVGGRWLSVRKYKDHYIQVVFCVGAKRYMPVIHRLVAEAFIPNPCNLPEINHKDGNKHNNAIENLEWVTRSQNIKHAWDSGLQRVTESRRRHGSDLHHKYAPWRNK